MRHDFLLLMWTASREDARIVIARGETCKEQLTAARMEANVGASVGTPRKCTLCQ
jgi:hypothetical protein